MAYGEAEVTVDNKGNGTIEGVEDTLLFIGQAPSNQNTVCKLDSGTDLDDMFGEDNSVLKTNVKAAMLNAGPNFTASAIPLANGGDWLAAAELAMDEDVSPEFIVVTSPVGTKVDIEAAHAMAVNILNRHKRRVVICIAAPGIDSGLETWASYFTAMNTLIDGAAAARVLVVPQLHGNELGILAGRLVSDKATIADTPMRVETGPAVGLGPVPVDSTGAKLTLAQIHALGDMRYTTIDRHEGYIGTYFSDGNMLDVPGGDFAVIEHLRIVDKAARQILILATSDIGSRRLNSSPDAMANAKTKYMAPLREMATGTLEHPGDIKKVTGDNIEIIWKSKTEVHIYFTLTPLNSAKTIGARIALNLQ
ncbi:MAG: DUF2586 family protein [Algicola sp.]|nr:DUF2586 family protein [Algicola sp.]